MVTLDEEEEEEGESAEWVKWHDGEMETRNRGRDRKLKKINKYKKNTRRANASGASQSAVELNRQLWDYQQR